MNLKKILFTLICSILPTSIFAGQSSILSLMVDNNMDNTAYQSSVTNKLASPNVSLLNQFTTPRSRDSFFLSFLFDCNCSTIVQVNKTDLTLSQSNGEMQLLLNTQEGEVIKESLDEGELVYLSVGGKVYRILQLSSDNDCTSTVATAIDLKGNVFEFILP